LTNPEHPGLLALRSRREAEDAAYAEVLAAVDAVARAAAAAAAPVPPEDLEQANAMWSAAPRPADSGLRGALRGRAWDALSPALERQAAFNAAVVRVLNAQAARAQEVSARLAELSAALVRYAQRVQPLVDARDRVMAALATTRSELVLESFDRRLESLAVRLDRLALRDALAGMGPVLELPDPADAVSILERQAEGSLGAVAFEAGDAARRQVEEIAAAARRALRPGGGLAVSAASAEEVAAAVAAAGFADARVDRSPVRSRPVVLARR
jgi:hypothetical protein